MENTKENYGGFQFEKSSSSQLATEVWTEEASFGSWMLVQKSRKPRGGLPESIVGMEEKLLDQLRKIQALFIRKIKGMEIYGIQIQLDDKISTNHKEDNHMDMTINGQVGGNVVGQDTIDYSTQRGDVTSGNKHGEPHELDKEILSTVVAPPNGPAQQIKRKMGLRLKSQVRFKNVKSAAHHKPLLLDPSPCTHINAPKPLCFLVSWLEESSFKEIVSGAWGRELSWCDVVQIFQRSMLEWNQNDFGNIIPKKRRVLARLEGVNKQLCMDHHGGLDKFHKKLWEDYQSILIQL
ncbi:hypothetical protein SESBI_28487 [Sesbania bispinosa]|nr:hypothetical protein SESBI_28487 [Sesbania bispinosa]